VVVVALLITTDCVRALADVP
jgi:hypothetical protein